MVIIGLNQLLQEMLAEPVGGALFESMGVGGLYLYVALIAFGSFFVGGLIVGWWSPGPRPCGKCMEVTMLLQQVTGSNRPKSSSSPAPMLPWMSGMLIL